MKRGIKLFLVLSVYIIANSYFVYSDAIPSVVPDPSCTWTTHGDSSCGWHTCIKDSVEVLLFGRRVDCYFGEMQNALGFGSYNTGFYDDAATAAKICDLTNTIHTAATPTAYPIMWQFTTSAFTSPGDNSIAQWDGDSWNTMPADDHNSMIDAIYCKKAPSCVPTKTCSDYHDQCANNLSNGCNGTIDCTNNCSSGDVCNEITGYCYTPTYYTPWNCSDNQTIMKLLYLTDSTGALWNDSIFQWKICYDKFFPSYVKQDPHNCTIRNNVVNLSAITNANASVLGDYPIPICFGDLVCRSVNITNNQSCNANERSILSLSALTNARMSNETSSNYSIRICCKSVPFIRGSAAFQDMNENNLTSSHVNDTLRLVLFREDVNNSVVNYSIFKKSCEGVTDCVWQWLFGDSKVAQFYSIGFSNYKFTETGEFYFNATVQGYPDVYSSDILTVGSQSNAVPRITIMKPVEGSNFTIRSNNNLTDSISFEQTSSDEDDLIDVYWDFDDGYIYHGMNCNNGTNRYFNNDCNTTHRYNSSAAGTRIVNATAIETTRTNGSNQYQYDLSRIFVYKEGFNLFIIMDQPNYKTRTFNPEPITISAVSTHVADCSYNWGICNGTAGLIGKSCYNVSDAAFNSSLKIFCYRYAESSDARFNFTWSIDGETKSWYPTNSSPFIKVFPEGGEHFIGLRVRFNL